MIIKCIFNSVKNISMDYRCLNETDETDYSFLTIGSDFTVYGLMFFSNRVDYLICLDDNYPIWVPSNLFEVNTQELPNNWSLCITYLNSNYKILDDSFGIKSIISYHNLVNNISHYIGLLERNPDDLKLFFLEKKKIDDQQSFFY
ncbi:hypothetical protein [Providencia rettgeri]|uniref:hypothetical protein n=1 Tax=Providencia rettgeri TaxID=587 RepID=UPI001BA5C397|nr:hypothetical protein [Providencia rettgeri]EMC8781285.1 hypothetical protein [Providencia rettgeri]MBS0861609.1 hypothetical protein [Providencia rettgeri]MBS0875540.1 hypothetical protein [Providencia rettgeri]MBS0922665.1 hypothetical protein [Providencia rettgeri]